MTKERIIDKLNSQPGYMADHFIVGVSVGALFDNGSGKYTAYYWYNFERFDDKISFTGTDKEAQEVFEAFRTVYSTMYKVAKDGAAKRIQVKVPGLGAATPGLIVTIFSSLVGLFFVGSLLDYVIMKSGGKLGEKMRGIYTPQNPKDPSDKRGPEFELLARIGILAIIGAVAGTSYRIDKKYREALDTLARYKVIRYSTITGVVTKAQAVTKKELKEAEKLRKDDNSVVNFGATDKELEQKYKGFQNLTKSNKQQVRTMDNAGKSKSDIMKFINEHKNDGNQQQKESKKPTVEFFADQIAVNVKSVFKDKWTKIFVLAGVVLASFILLDLIRGNRTEEEALNTSKSYIRLSWFKSLFDRVFGKLI